MFDSDNVEPPRVEKFKDSEKSKRVAFSIIDLLEKEFGMYGKASLEDSKEVLKTLTIAIEAVYLGVCDLFRFEVSEFIFAANSTENCAIIMMPRKLSRRGMRKVLQAIKDITLEGE